MNHRPDHSLFLPRSSRVRANDIIAALDIGTSKVTCLIAKVQNGRAHESGEGSVMRVIGFSSLASHGLQAGQIVDMVAAEDSIRSVVETAEHMAGVELDRVVVGLSAGQLRSQKCTAQLALNGRVVGDRDIVDALERASQTMGARDDEILHAVPINYWVDDSRRLVDPRGMSGARLGVELHIVSAPMGAVRNFMACVDRCHLVCDKLVATPYAGALSALMQDEIELGTLLIDMGGGTTSFAICYEGAPIYMGVVPVGGHHITADIARGFSLSLSAAERIKTLYGSAVALRDDGVEQFEIPRVDMEQEARIAQCHELDRVVHPRIDEMFELLRGAIDASGCAQYAGNRVVLTGGASLFSGMTERAARALAAQVRLGTPTRILGLPEIARGPAFTACAGLVSYARKRQFDVLLDPIDTENVSLRVVNFFKKLVP